MLTSLKNGSFDILRSLELPGPHNNFRIHDSPLNIFSKTVHFVTSLAQHFYSIASRPLAHVDAMLFDKCHTYYEEFKA